MVGWVAGGGSLTDPRAIILAFFFFIWQVPHFWLLMLKYGEEYVKAGYPSITQLYSTAQVKKITFIWILATAVSALMLPAFHVVQSLIVIIGMPVSSIWLVVSFSRLIFKQDELFRPMKYFMKINYYVLMMLNFPLAESVYQLTAGFISVPSVLPPIRDL